MCDSGKRGEARAPFGAECGKTSNLQLYRVSTFGRDGPGKKSRTNSHTLAEWPQSVCVTSWCIDLCVTMQRARVFSSLLYQDVMVLDVPEKDPPQPCKKTPVPQSLKLGARRLGSLGCSGHGRHAIPDGNLAHSLYSKHQQQPLAPPPGARPKPTTGPPSSIPKSIR